MLFRPLIYTASQIINFLLQKYINVLLYLYLVIKAGANYLAMVNFNDFVAFFKIAHYELLAFKVPTISMFFDCLLFFLSLFLFNCFLIVVSKFYVVNAIHSHCSNQRSDAESKSNSSPGTITNDANDEANRST